MSSVEIIAEAGSIHDGSFGLATKLIELAADCGADLVKFQTHIAAAETLRNAPMPSYFKGEPRYEYFERTGFTVDQWTQLAAHAKKCNIEFLSSPFSIEAVALLEKVGVARYKIPSGEVSNIPLIEAVAKTGKPVFLSSGMSSWRELEAAVRTFRQYGNKLCIMQCTSSYPCPPERVGLNILAELRERYGAEVGYSDHTLDNYACFAAVTLGATVIEKHITFSRQMYGSDAAHSAEPPQFMDLVRGVREISAIIAQPVVKDDIGEYAEMKRIFEKSVVSVRFIPAGTTITPDMIAVKKPGDGIPAARFNDVVGSKSKTDIPKDTQVRDSAIEWRA